MEAEGREDTEELKDGEKRGREKRPVGEDRMDKNQDESKGL